MIEKLSHLDADAIYNIINSAARIYRGAIPDDCYHEPYMPREELEKEMTRMTFFGWKDRKKLVGVMGFQPVDDVTLIRHAYVLPEYQGKGIGTRLLQHLKQITDTRRLLVGTWRGATRAIQFYQKQEFKFLSNKDALLRRYWGISERQIETSVVLAIDL